MDDLRFLRLHRPGSRHKVYMLGFPTADKKALIKGLVSLQGYTNREDRFVKWAKFTKSD